MKAWTAKLWIDVASKENKTHVQVEYSLYVLQYWDLLVVAITMVFKIV